MECQTCKFYEEFRSWKYGDCRRYPPTVIKYSDGVKNGWPRVEENDWCGEWQAKKEERPRIIPLPD